MGISADDIKTLREETGVSVMDVKKALEEANGDAEKAREILKARGASVAAKKSDRATGSGRVEAYVHGEGKIGVLLVLRCETDFVAKNEEFKTLAKDIAMHIAAMGPKDVEELMGQEFIKNPSQTVKERIEETIGKTGENITVSHFSREEI